MAQRARTNSADYRYTVHYRDIRYPRLEFKTGALQIILPRAHRTEVEELLEKHSCWIDSRRMLIQASLREAKKRKLYHGRSDQDLRALVRELVRKNSRDGAHKPGRIYFRQLRTKWASCSSRGNLTFNRLLRYLPRSLIEYVVYHELMHINKRKHNQRFWDAVRRKYRNAHRWEKTLLTYWFLIQENLRSGEIRTR